MADSNLHLSWGSAVTRVIYLFHLALFILPNRGGFRSVSTPLMSPPLNACFSNNASFGAVMDRP